MTTESESQHGEVLGAIGDSRRDFALLQDKHWCRIPVDIAPRPWPPQWLALYQIKVFDDERWSANCYGHVRDIRIGRGRELGLYEPPHPKANSRHYKVHLEGMERLAQSILKGKP